MNLTIPVWNEMFEIETLPGILLIYLLQMNGPRAFEKIALVLVTSIAFYCASVARFGGRLDQSRERIALALSSSV